MQRAKLSKAFLRLLQRAGVNNPQKRSQKKADGGRAVSTKSFHSLRHSLISHLADAGVSPELRSKISGHADLKVHAGYTTHDEETLRAAFRSLPTIRD